MLLENTCTPALIYIIFSMIQIIIDTSKGLFNVAFVKFWVSLIFTFLLNYLCESGLGIISWILVFIPFILMTLIISIILYVFGLDPEQGRIQFNGNGITQEKHDEYIDNRPEREREIDRHRHHRPHHRRDRYDDSSMLLPYRENGRIDDIQRDVSELKEMQKQMMREKRRRDKREMDISTYARTRAEDPSQFEYSEDTVEDPSLDVSRKEADHLEEDVNEIIDKVSKETEEESADVREPVPSEENILDSGRHPLCPKGCFEATSISGNCRLGEVDGEIKMECPWECKEPSFDIDQTKRCRVDTDCHEHCRPFTYFNYDGPLQSQPQKQEVEQEPQKKYVEFELRNQCEGERVSVELVYPNDTKTILENETLTKEFRKFKIIAEKNGEMPTSIRFRTFNTRGGPCRIQLNGSVKVGGIEKFIPENIDGPRYNTFKDRGDERRMSAIESGGFYWNDTYIVNFREKEPSLIEGFRDFLRLK